jgi:RNA polymerase sigma-70 factor (ECF subfamily)
MNRNPKGRIDPDMTTEAWLINPAATRPETDFDTLFLAHYDGVYRLLYRIVGAREEAEDLAQETFLRLARQRFRAGQEHNVRAWLYRVATNLAYNALRGEARRTRRQERFTHENGADELDPTQAALLVDEQAAVRHTLASLSEKQSQLLLLRHAGLSYRELAATLGVARGSVGTLLARAEAAFEKAYRAKVREEGGR